VGPDEKEGSALIHLFMPVALLGGGLAAGGLMITVLGGVPLLRALPTPREYVIVHRFLATRFDPFMPLCLVFSMVSNFLLAFFVPTATERSLALVSAVLFLTVMIISLVKNVPINRWLQTLDPDALPPDWERLDPRDRWGSWNAIRTTIAVAAFLADAILIAVTV
jgi:uncharacterized membrane protein